MIRIINDTPSVIKIWANDLEENAEKQIRQTASLPFIYSHVAVMADAHAGRGSTIGSVIATQGAIIPSAVGVDIGCGMCALQLPIEANELENLKTLRHSIERSVPTGREGNREVSNRVDDIFSAMGAPPSFPIENKLVKNAIRQMGSLGGGNHFIEICTDEFGKIWIMLHSGSRNIGKELAERHIDKAKGLAKERMLELPDPDLAYFTESMPEFQAYIGDLLWAQEYAKNNRNEMLLRIVKDLSYHLYQDARLLAQMNSFFRVDCHHNFCQLENHFGTEVWITRKGAVSAKAGQYGIIPGSMGAKSFIVQGKGNPESFNSCSHGAGRKMSRTEARRKFNESDLQLQTVGVECRKDRAVIDEIPSAYKDIDEVMKNQEDLVEPIFQLKQILCIKGG
jgi:tRNA-splicing ligase RtcB